MVSKSRRLRAALLACSKRVPVWARRWAFSASAVLRSAALALAAASWALASAAWALASACCWATAAVWALPSASLARVSAVCWAWAACFAEATACCWSRLACWVCRVASLACWVAWSTWVLASATRVSAWAMRSSACLIEAVAFCPWFQANQPEPAATKIPAAAAKAPISAPRRSFFSAASWASWRALPARIYSCCKPVGRGSTSAHRLTARFQPFANLAPAAAGFHPAPAGPTRPIAPAAAWVSKCSRFVSSVRSNPAKFA